MTRAFYKDATACVVAYDVSKSSTLKNGAVKWKQDFDAKLVSENGQAIPCILIGNKVRSEGCYFSLRAFHQ